MANQQPALRHPTALIELVREAIGKGDGFWLKLFGISMHPFIKAGDAALVRPAAWESLSAGQVVLFERNQRLIAHRVLRAPSGPEGSLLVKGDTMLRADPPVMRGQLLGEVVALKRGSRTVWLSSRPRRLWAALLVRLSYPYSGLFYRGILLHRAVMRALPALHAYRAWRRRRAPAVEFRRAGSEDVLSLAALLCDEEIRRSFEQVEEAAEVLLRETSRAGGEIHLAQVGRTLVGCLVAVPGQRCWRVERLYVHSVWRGMGLGERLLTGFLRSPARAGGQVEVALPVQSAAARGLARKVGLEPAGGCTYRLSTSSQSVAQPPALAPKTTKDLAGNDAL